MSKQLDSKNAENSNELYKLLHKLLPTIDFTGYYDDNKKPIFVGDTLRSKLGYYVIVVKDGDSYGGKLVCEDNHSCKYISYALNKGAGHIKINCL